VNTLKNWIESLMKHFHKHPIEGRWTLVSREGQLTPHEATREFARTSYRWTDEGRAEVTEAGQYSIDRLSLTAVSAAGVTERFAFRFVSSDQILIQQFEPTLGRVSIYRRTKSSP